MHCSSEWFIAENIDRINIYNFYLKYFQYGEPWFSSSFAQFITHKRTIPSFSVIYKVPGERWNLQLIARECKYVLPVGNLV
jgi:hypothetical protein